MFRNIYSHPIPVTIEYLQRLHEVLELFLRKSGLALWFILIWKFRTKTVSHRVTAKVVHLDSCFRTRVGAVLFLVPCLLWWSFQLEVILGLYCYLTGSLFSLIHSSCALFYDNIKWWRKGEDSIVSRKHLPYRLQLINRRPLESVKNIMRYQQICVVNLVLSFRSFLCLSLSFLIYVSFNSFIHKSENMLEPTLHD